jgi:hypothetical protein
VWKEAVVDYFKVRFHNFLELTRAKYCMGSIPDRFKRFFSTQNNPDCVWNPPSLLSKGYQGLFPRGLSDSDVKLINHLQLLTRSKWSSYASTPHTSS